MARAEAQFHRWHLEIRPAEFLQHPFQVGHADTPVNRQALNLMEHRRMRLVHIHPVHAARCNHPDRCALIHQRAYLHRARVCAQHMRRAVIPRIPVHEERVMFLPRRMFRRNVQRIKVIPVGFHLRAFGHRKTHVRKDRCQLFHHLADRVDRAHAPWPCRQRHIQPFRPQPRVQCRIAKCCLLGPHACINLVAQHVQQSARRLALVRLHLAKARHQQRYFALLAQRRQPHLFQRRLIRCRCNSRQIFDLKCLQPVHRSLLARRMVLTGRGVRCKPRQRKTPPVGRGSILSKHQCFALRLALLPWLALQSR